MHVTRISDGRHGARAVCGLALVIVLIILLSLQGRDQARAEEGGLFDFFSVLPGKAAADPAPLSGVAPWADDMKKARAAYGRGEFDKARSHFEAAAAGGNVTASCYLGHMYRLGRGVEASTRKSLQYYQNVAGAFTDEPDLRSGAHHGRCAWCALPISIARAMPRKVSNRTRRRPCSCTHRGVLRTSLCPLWARRDVA